MQVPHYDELSVKSLYPQFKKDPDMMKFFPDTYPKGKGPPRDYFFNILNTIHPDYLAQIMAHADEQRFAAEGERMKNETIQISDFWAEQLKAMPYLTRKHSYLFLIISSIILL